MYPVKCGCVLGSEGLSAPKHTVPLAWQPLFDGLWWLAQEHSRNCSSSGGCPCMFCSVCSHSFWGQMHKGTSPMLCPNPILWDYNFFKRHFKTWKIFLIQSQALVLNPSEWPVGTHSLKIQSQSSKTKYHSEFERRRFSLLKFRLWLSSWKGRFHVVHGFSSSCCKVGLVPVLENLRKADEWVSALLQRVEVHEHLPELYWILCFLTAREQV